jgi:hypothetical protein
LRIGIAAIGDKFGVGLAGHATSSWIYNRGQGTDDVVNSVVCDGRGVGH